MHLTLLQWHEIFQSHSSSLNDETLLLASHKKNLAIIMSIHTSIYSSTWWLSWFCMRFHDNKQFSVNWLNVTEKKIIIMLILLLFYFVQFFVPPRRHNNNNDNNNSRNFAWSLKILQNVKKKAQTWQSVEVKILKLMDAIFCYINFVCTSMRLWRNALWVLECM